MPSWQTRGSGSIADIYCRRGHHVRRAAWRRPLDVTDLGAFGPKVLLLGASAQNTPPGCICGELDCRAVASYFLFLSQKESKQSLSALRAAYGGCAPRRAFCEADVPEGARSDPSGLGAEMLPPERCERSFAPCGERPGRCPGPAALTGLCPFGSSGRGLRPTWTMPSL